MKVAAERVCVYSTDVDNGAKLNVITDKLAGKQGNQKPISVQTPTLTQLFPRRPAGNTENTGLPW